MNDAMLGKDILQVKQVHIFVFGTVLVSNTILPRQNCEYGRRDSVRNRDYITTLARAAYQTSIPRCANSGRT